MVSVLGEMDAWIICPFFLQGGRYTIDDIHYVADSERLTVNLHTKTHISYHLDTEIVWGFCSHRLVPAGETEFSEDAAFGYRSSDLKEVLASLFYQRFPSEY